MKDKHASPHQGAARHWTENHPRSTSLLLSRKPAKESKLSARLSSDIQLQIESGTGLGLWSWGEPGWETNSGIVPATSTSKELWHILQVPGDSKRDLARCCLAWAKEGVPEAGGAPTSPITTVPRGAATMAPASRHAFQFGQGSSPEIHLSGSGHTKITSLEPTREETQTPLKAGLSLRFKD